MDKTRKTIHEIIVKVLKNNDFSDHLLEQAAKKMEGSDRERMYAVVKGTIKMQNNLAYIVKKFTDADKFLATDIKIKSLLFQALYELIFMDATPEHAAVNENVELAKQLYSEKVGDFINAVLRSYLRNPEITYPQNAPERIATEHSYPQNIVERWISYWGEENAEYLCMYFNEPPKLHMRVNNLATSPQKLINYFQKREVILEQSAASANILITKDAAKALTDVSFAEGYFSVQDTSAALVVELLSPQKDYSILDLFAAPGGKASYMGELMDNTGEIIAIDRSPAKVKLIKRGAERLQVTNINAIAQDAFKYGPLAPAFDAVLTDAPCSGWGVFGKKAELRWQANQDIPGLLKLQEMALHTASQFVKKNGVLIYSTCTLNHEENEEQVAKFLATHPHFEKDNATKYVKAEYTENGFLKTVPHRHHMDGAFGARLIKIDDGRKK